MGYPGSEGVFSFTIGPTFIQSGIEESVLLLKGDIGVLRRDQIEGAGFLGISEVSSEFVVLAGEGATFVLTSLASLLLFVPQLSLLSYPHDFLNFPLRPCRHDICMDHLSRRPTHTPLVNWRHDRGSGLSSG